MHVAKKYVLKNSRLYIVHVYRYFWSVLKLLMHFFCIFIQYSKLLAVVILIIEC